MWYAVALAPKKTYSPHAYVTYMLQTPSSDRHTSQLHQLVMGSVDWRQQIMCIYMHRYGDTVRLASALRKLHTSPRQLHPALLMLQSWCCIHMHGY
jgi:hypothetical protein